MRILHAAVAAVAAAAAFVLYLLFEAQWVRLVERDVPVPGLASQLDGLCIAHLSDMHVGFRPSLNLRATRKAFALTRAARPDLIAITGDLSGGSANLAALKRGLATLTAPLGVFAVLGNHDHGESKAPFVSAVDLSDLGDVGVRLLDNECVAVDVRGARLHVCGIDDWRHGYGDLAAVRPVEGDVGVRLLLSHYADAALELPAHEFALTLSGDTHGGQICLPWFGGPIMCSQPRAAFKDGLYEVRGRRVHVTRGIGTSLLPFRLLCRPEVVLLRLRAA